jgi:ribose 5-phosphate isomerase B
MKISLGSDHAGFRYKEKVKELLGSLGHEVKDFGTFSEEPVDYPLFIRPAAEAVARGECDRGIVFGGSGNGEAMVANKVHGVRCALCWNEESAQLSRHTMMRTCSRSGRTSDSRRPRAKDCADLA